MSSRHTWITGDPDLPAYPRSLRTSLVLRADIQTSRKRTYINLTPLKPQFYIVKLGFTGVYINFLISAQNIGCGYSFKLPIEAVLTSTHNLCFEQVYETYQNCFIYIFFYFLVVKFSVYFE